MKTKKENEDPAFLRFFKNRNVYNLAVMAITAIIVFFIVQSASLPQKYRVAIGERSEYDINAPFDMIDERATEKSAREAANNAPKEYIRSSDKSGTMTSAAESFAQTVLNERAILDDLTEVNKGDPSRVALLQENSVSRLIEKVGEYDVSISREQASSILASISLYNLTSFLDSLVGRVNSYSEMDITNENINFRINSLHRSIQSGSDNQNLKNMGISFVTGNIIVNMVINTERTEELQEEAYLLGLESKKVVHKGSRVLNVDEFVTEDKYALLADFGLVWSDEVDFAPLLKTLVIILLMSGVLLFYFNNFCKKYFYDKRLILLPAIVIVIVMVACRVLRGNIYAMPVYLAPLLVAYLVGLWPSLMVNAYIISAISLFFGMEVSTLLLFFIGGILASFLTYNATQRSRFSVAGVVLAASTSIVRIVVSESVMQPQSYLWDCLTLSIACIISALLSIGLIALFEGIFNTSTPLRLIELSSGSSHLLKRLSFEAPGTHHHSLMVGYMAEAAALEIGANPLLARAGAYYHDVGKLKRPEFFTENQNGNNPHDVLPPEKSASIIIAHTIDGVEMCDKYKLPIQVKSIVREHHGDTMAGFFCSKAKNLYGAVNVNEADYRYSGPKPSQKESAIVMMADSCEAAVRSSETRDEGEIKAIVDRIIKNKIDDGQLNLSALGINDVTGVKKEFVRVLCGFYHSRIKYPGSETNDTVSIESIAQQWISPPPVATGPQMFFRRRTDPPPPQRTHPSQNQRLNA